MGRPPMPDEEEPRREPEIIPPDRNPERAARDSSGIWVSIDGSNGRRSSRIYLAKPSPLAMILAVVVLAALVALILVVLIGVFVIWVPALVLLAAAFMLSGLVRGYFRRQR